MEYFLTIPEEIYLLTIDEKKGQQGGVPENIFNVVLSSSILMDLAVQQRIDSDIEGTIIPDSKEKTGNAILDEILMQIHSSKENKDILHWITYIFKDIKHIKERIVDNLVSKGILKIEEQKVLWVFSSRKYPKIANKEVKEVKNRLREIIFSDEIPDFRDIAIISLVHHGEMIQFILTDNELEKHRQRIEDIAQLDLIGQSIAAAVDDITIALTIGEKKGLMKGKSPLEEFKEMIEATKKKYRIKRDDVLPAWMREGTEQYKMSLKFISEKGTGMIIYNPKKKEYSVRKFSGSYHIFGSGE